MKFTTTAWITLLSTLVMFGVLTPAALAADDPARQYTFAWLFTEDSDMKPRGGTTRGSSVTLDKTPSKAWQALSEPEITKQERDRRAILAMAGPYRTSFDFIETAGFVTGYEPAAPYQSWGTEYVYVVEDREDFVSLQHILVMVMQKPDGSTMEPIVVKHWRHDWEYEARDQHVFTGHSTWTEKQLSRRDARGTWTQRVFQVDDSPRYQAKGVWTHHDNYSSWHSEETWRPLPRREFSVRDDYHVLVGTNKHTITPTGWVQEEENLKVVLDAEGRYASGTTVLAKEVGLARYERIADFDWSAGDEYWERTGAFWKDVRDVWADTFDKYERVALKATVDDKPLFMTMFGLAPDDAGSPAPTRLEIEAALVRYLEQS